jgi:hypothetical protein
MPSTPQPRLLPPGALIIGPSSPVQGVLGFIKGFLLDEPHLNSRRPDAELAGAVIANHFLMLFDACGTLNVSGMHSAAVALLRLMEDALDVFVAVTTVDGAAQRWENGTLKPSDAGKAWAAHHGNPQIVDAGGEGLSLDEYRKRRRNMLNKYSHGSYDLCAWDLFCHPLPSVPGTAPMAKVKINHARQVIAANAHAIDASVTATLLEFLGLFQDAYSNAIGQFDQERVLARLITEIEAITRDHTAHRCQDVSRPRE